jgi:hypothetical protein
VPSLAPFEASRPCRAHCECIPAVFAGVSATARPPARGAPKPPRIASRVQPPMSCNRKSRQWIHKKNLMSPVLDSSAHAHRLLAGPCARLAFFGVRGRCRPTRAARRTLSTPCGGSPFLAPGAAPGSGACSDHSRKGASEVALIRKAACLGNLFERHLRIQQEALSGFDPLFE